MKYINYLLAGLFCSPLFFNLQAQSPGNAFTEGFNIAVDEGYQCVTDQQRELSNQKIAESIQMLKDQGKLFYNEASKPDYIQFAWPLKKAEGVGYNQIWGVSNFVDHQGGSGIKDYFCQEKTYNGHRGTDIYLWPFWWYAMDHNQAEIIAAADGQILYKFDGNYDRSCVMGSGDWNAVYVQHADGSIAWYGHMKNGSLTTKNVGDMVSKGEFLGNVGSSGSSTGPHLHFEVYNSSSQLIDPFEGSCNLLNSESWWEDQLPHDKPTINAVLTHSAYPVFPDCPQQEVTNLKNYFETGESVYLAVYLTDQEAGSTMHLKVTRPNGTILNEWDAALTENYQLSYWFWIANPDMNGNWKWEATYKGVTVVHDFYVGVMGTAENEIKDFKTFPNPAYDQINLQAPDKIVDVQIIDTQGRTVKHISSLSGIDKVDVKSLPAGFYVIKAADIQKKTSTVKIMKK